MQSRIKGNTIGVMGSSGKPDHAERERLLNLADQLGAAIADRGCILVTGATTGIPDMVSRAVKRNGGITVGISPAANQREHCEEYGLPTDGVDVLVYTGFGLKGRNVINVRSSDIVIIVGGGMGTLNEFTIAYDEGKVIGCLEGSGGITTHIRELLQLSRRPSRNEVIFGDDPVKLVDDCLAAIEREIKESASSDSCNNS
jgi:uncharacterized protein (TIGR00725 family)